MFIHFRFLLCFYENEIHGYNLRISININRAYSSNWLAIQEINYSMLRFYLKSVCQLHLMLLPAYYFLSNKLVYRLGSMFTLYHCLCVGNISAYIHTNPHILGFGASMTYSLYSPLNFRNEKHLNFIFHCHGSKLCFLRQDKQNSKKFSNCQTNKN